MKRKRLSARERANIFSKHNGVCHICKGKINAAIEAWEVSHPIPLAAGGKDEDHNREPAHKKCHKVRTDKIDKPLIARVRRKANRNNGVTRPKGTIKSAGFPVKEKREKIPMPKRTTDIYGRPI